MKKYIEKLESDINEGMYDLLITHLNQIGADIHAYGEDKSLLITVIEQGIEHIKDHITEYNTLFMYRYILLCANKILFLDKTNEYALNVKKDIIAQYVHRESVEQGHIPLDDQLTEIRITHDTTYLKYLIKKLYEDKEYVKALYCLEALRILEPDDAIIDEYYNSLDALFPKIQGSTISTEQPRNATLVLDSNVVISHIVHDVEDFRLKSHPEFDLEKLGNFNSFVMLPCVIEEVRSHLQATYSYIDKVCSKNKRFDAEGIKATLDKRLEKYIAKYGVVFDKETLQIEDFYKQRLGVLRTIMDEKLSKQHKRSHKLRTLAKRTNFLPEQGDMLLLEQACTLKGKIWIVSNDSDFQYFASDIAKEFGIYILE